MDEPQDDGAGMPVRNVEDLLNMLRQLAALAQQLDRPTLAARLRIMAAEGSSDAPGASNVRLLSSRSGGQMTVPVRVDMQTSLVKLIDDFNRTYGFDRTTFLSIAARKYLNAESASNGDFD